MLQSGGWRHYRRGRGWKRRFVGVNTPERGEPDINLLKTL